MEESRLSAAAVLECGEGREREREIASLNETLINYISAHRV